MHAFNFLASAALPAVAADVRVRAAEQAARATPLCPAHGSTSGAGGSGGAVDAGDCVDGAGAGASSVGWAVGTGVTGADGAEVAPVPTELVAVTVNVYDAPFVRPLTVQVVAGVAGATDVTEHDSPVPAVTV